MLSLATRLTIGVAPWRDPAAVAAAVRGWVMSSIIDAAVFVAHDDHTVLGFVTVAERRHFTGVLSELASLADRDDITGPTLILIGQAAAEGALSLAEPLAAARPLRVRAA